MPPTLHTRELRLKYTFEAITVFCYLITGVDRVWKLLFLTPLSTAYMLYLFEMWNNLKQNMRELEIDFQGFQSPWLSAQFFLINFELFFGHFLSSSFCKCDSKTWKIQRTCTKLSWKKFESWKLLKWCSSFKEQFFPK